MDIQGKNYCGLTIDWNYDKEYVDIYMQTYITKSLKRFLHPAPPNTCYTSHKWKVTAYGKIDQYEKGP